MERKGFILAVWLAVSISVSASSSNYKLVNGQDDFYYGHISYAEIKNDGQDPLVYREGRLIPETAVLNLPLGPGDTIQTKAERRAEVQFDNGTIVRLDLDSRLKIEAILAQSLSTSKKMSNLILEKGQVYVMYKKYDSQEIFQIVAPGAAIKLDHNSVALIRLTEGGDIDVQVERGKAFLLYGGDKAHLSRKSINAKQRGIVKAEDRFELAEYEVLSDFKAWNESLNAHFPELHEGSYLPKPLRRNVTKATFEFAQKFGNIYGEWIWHDLYGYVWRPYLNDSRYPWGTWTPYINGSWTSYRGGLFWVPAEPWGWVPYHLGIWMWDKNKGWVWLPGSLFAPAWAVWDFYAGIYCWRPFYLYDWMFGFDDFWGYSLWGGYYGFYDLPYSPPSTRPSQNIISSIRKDELKKKDAPSLPMPKEMKKVLTTTLAALRQGDQSLWASIESLPGRSVFIKKRDFLSEQWQEKIVPFGRLSKEIGAAPQAAKPASLRRSFDSSRDAWLTIERSRIPAELKARMVLSPDKSQEKSPPAPRDIEFSRGNGAAPGPAAASPSFRFLDWNPDIKTAIKLGVEISYSSRTNEVTCPQLRLSSHQINPAMRTEGSFGGFKPSSGDSFASEYMSTTGSAADSPGKSSASVSSSSQKEKEKEKEKEKN